MGLPPELKYSYAKNENSERIVELIESDFDIVEVPYVYHSYAQKGNCYMNVKGKILKDQGTIQYGWAVFQNAFMIEAEHHAVWQNDKDCLFDITPRSSTFSSIAFIPDDRIVYSGAPIDNIRLNLTNNPVVDDFIWVVEITEDIKASGTRTGDYKIRLNDHLISLYDYYSDIASDLLTFFATGKNEKSKCFCGSERTYQGCHSEIVKRRAELDLRNIPGKAIRLPHVATVNKIQK